MKKLKIVSIFFSVVLLLTVELQAYTVELLNSNTEITPGDSVVVSIKISDLEEEIDSYQAKLVYDSNEFNTVTEEDFEVKNGWNGLVYNESNGVFVVERDEKTMQSEELLTLILVSKSTIKSDELNISLENNLVSGGKNDLEAANASLNIEIIKDNIYGYEINGNYIEKVSPKTPIDNFKEELTNGTDCTVNVKENGAKIETGYMKTGMTVEITKDGETNEYKVSVIGDANGDGYANSLDSKMIKAYRNEVLSLDPVSFKAADINDDGKVNSKDSKLLLYHRADVKGYNLNYSK